MGALNKMLRLTLMLLGVTLLIASQSPVSAQNNPFGAAVGQTGPGVTVGTDDNDGGIVVRIRNRDRVIAPSGQPEIMVLAPNNEAQAAVDALTANGARFLRQRDYPSLGRTGLFFTLGSGGTIQSARRALAGPAPNSVLSLHVLYRFAQGSPRVYALEMVGLASASGGCRFGGGITIGVIDGPVDPGHPALAGVPVTVDSVLSEGDRSVSTDHGTAVAALIAGQGGDLTGFASGARLHAVAAFARSGNGVGASSERVIAAIDRLIGQGVRLINMSFAGPPNQVLEVALATAASRGVTMIAAAGNTGTNATLYPAGSPSVIAVTAVDAGGRLYRSANTGGHIEFAAPGVDVFVASGRGGSYQSGTSYAAPIITALAARLGGGSINTVRSRLQAASVDLGAPGRDGQYGWGLVRSSGC